MQVESFTCFNNVTHKAMIRLIMTFIFYAKCYKLRERLAIIQSVIMFII